MSVWSTAPSHQTARHRHNVARPPGLVGASRMGIALWPNLRTLFSISLHRDAQCWQRFSSCSMSHKRPAMRPDGPGDPLHNSARPSARLQARSMLVVARSTGGPGRALRCSDPQANALCAEPSFRPPGPVDMRVGEALILRHLLQARTSRLSQCRRFVLWTHGACLLQLQRHYLRVEQ